MNRHLAAEQEGEHPHAGTLHVVTGQIALPNGATLTPDGRTLLVDDTKGEEISGFGISPDGTTGPMA